MGEWLQEHILHLLATIATAGWFLVKLGEWKRGLRPENGVANQQLRREMTAAAEKAKQDAADLLAISFAQIDQRFDRANEELSRLTGKMQACPTRDEFGGLWKEVIRLRDTEEASQRSVAGLAERIARLEGRQ